MFSRVTRGIGKVEAWLNAWFWHRWSKWVLGSGALPGFLLLPPTTPSGLGWCSWSAFKCWLSHTRWLVSRTRAGAVPKSFFPQNRRCSCSTFNYWLTNIYSATTKRAPWLKSMISGDWPLGLNATSATSEPCELDKLWSPWRLTFLFYKRGCNSSCLVRFCEDQMR